MNIKSFNYIAYFFRNELRAVLRHSYSISRVSFNYFVRQSKHRFHGSGVFSVVNDVGGSQRKYSIEWQWKSNRPTRHKYKYKMLGLYTLNGKQ